MDTEERRPFRNSMGKLYTRGLFIEEGEDPSAFVYTLKERDWKGYPSLYRLYMETGDITEYRFATKHLEGWDHWTLLSGMEWFSPYVTRWRNELEVRLRSMALNAILDVSLDKASNSHFSANKYLLEGQWRPTKGRGRPSNQDIREEVIKAAERQRELAEDAARVLGKAN